MIHRFVWQNLLPEELVLGPSLGSSVVNPEPPPTDDCGSAPRLKVIQRLPPILSSKSFYFIPSWLFTKSFHRLITLSFGMSHFSMSIFEKGKCWPPEHNMMACTVECTAVWWPVPHFIGKYRNLVACTAIWWHVPQVGGMYCNMVACTTIWWHVPQFGLCTAI